MSRKFRVKRPDGSFDKTLYDSSAEAVFAASGMIDIEWKEGENAVTRLEQGLVSMALFKDSNTGEIVGVDTVETKTHMEYRLVIDFKHEEDRDQAENMLNSAYHNEHAPLGEFTISDRQKVEV